MSLLTLFGVNSMQNREIFLKLYSDPLFILKPVSTFTNENPFFFQLFIALVITIYCYIRAKRSGLASPFDGYWSLSPIFFSIAFVVHHQYHQSHAHPRLILCSILIISWGIRLTYNFYIKGGFKPGFEDHRWQQIHSWPVFIRQPWKWDLFLIFFVSIYQMLTVFMISVLPLFVVYYGPLQLQLSDIPLVVVFYAFLAIETVADLQMLEFQERKRRKILSRDYCQIRDYEVMEGYFCSGLYRFSRHPNYFAEVCLWWVVYLYGVFSGVNDGGIWMILNWSIIGILNFSGLMYKSAVFGEALTSFKYPNYKYYARRTNRFIPWWPVLDQKNRKQ